MAQKLQISFTADLLLQLSAGCSGQADAGLGYLPRLTSANLSADVQVGSKLASVDGGPVSLGLPANMLGRALYFRALGPRDPWVVSVTYATTGQVDQPIQGMLLLEAQPGDEVIGVSVTGSGEFEWCVWGGLA